MTPQMLNLRNKLENMATWEQRRTGCLNRAKEHPDRPDTKEYIDEANRCEQMLSKTIEQLHQALDLYTHQVLHQD